MRRIWKSQRFRCVQELLKFELDGVIVKTTVDRQEIQQSRHYGEAGGLSGAPLLARSNRALQAVVLN